jgi:hypothetical protein
MTKASSLGQFHLLENNHQGGVGRGNGRPVSGSAGPLLSRVGHLRAGFAHCPTRYLTNLSQQDLRLLPRGPVLSNIGPLAFPEDVVRATRLMLAIYCSPFATEEKDCP